MPIIVKAISSMEKCFMDEAISDKQQITRGSALRGEDFAFEVAYTSDEPGHHPKYTLTLDVQSPLRDCITVRQVEQMPVRLAAYRWSDDNYLRKAPGLYPDLLRPLDPKNEIFVTYGELKSLFVNVKIPKDLPGGDYPISICFMAGETPAASADITLHVVNAVLPKQEMIVTEWFHTDCIANYYDLETFSEKHWKYIESFMTTAVENGINAILMPVFTPPLDTAVGWERRTTQLVDVEKTSDGWKFGFDNVERWVAAAKRAGVEYYEVSHLYSQWGAVHAPKIMGKDENGQLCRLFGWETDATSDEYKGFLRSFLSAFIGKMKELGVEDSRMLFHISDEPSVEQLGSYKAAKDQIADLLEGHIIMDALSSFEFYKAGVCGTPIPSSNHIEPFIEANVPNLWTYYCCNQSVNVSNRFMAMSMARTRVIGTQFWKYNIAGFLQWGYNFYNSQGSIRSIDPYQVTDGDYFTPAGDCFSVYPGPNGAAYESLRIRAFTMALQDTRAMILAEKLAGREAVMAVLESEGEVTFSKYPHSAAWLEGVREAVNGMIEANI